MSRIDDMIRLARSGDKEGAKAILDAEIKLAEHSPTSISATPNGYVAKRKGKRVELVDGVWQPAKK